MTRTICLALVVCLGALASACRSHTSAAAEAAPVLAESIALETADRVRLAEAFRLAERLRDDIWEGWSQAPLAVLLITPEHEFLVRHPRPTEEFRLLRFDTLVQSEIHVRPRRFPLDLAAAFPAVAGVPTIVLGQPEHSGYTSSRWVLTLVHEHFHQLQYSQPGYYSGVNALDLAGGDQTGMWMLNYPFPFDSLPVQERFSSMTSALTDALDAAEPERFRAALSTFLEARDAFRSVLSEADYRYFAFQVWQEGVARYTEYRTGRLAAEYYSPTPAFRSLPDHTPFSEAADALERSILEGVRTADLGRQQRLAFYPVGAATALLLDRAAPNWKQRYFAEPFLVDRYFDVSPAD